MKKIILITAGLFLSTLTFGQNKADSLYYTGEHLYYNEDYAGAIICYKEIAKNHKDFKFYLPTIFYLAQTYEQADNHKNAIFWYKKIISANVNDDGFVNNGYSFDFYSSYKHDAAYSIAILEFYRENYRYALKYLMNSLKKYRCASKSEMEIKSSNNRTAILIAECFAALKKNDKALETIIPQVLFPLNKSDYVAAEVVSLDMIIYDLEKKQIAKELEESFKNMVENNGDYFEFRGSKFDLSTYLSDRNITVEALVSEIKKTDFWTELTMKGYEIPSTRELQTFYGFWNKPTE